MGDREVACAFHSYWADPFSWEDIFEFLLEGDAWDGWDSRADDV